jgi:hypothetical protein
VDSNKKDGRHFESSFHRTALKCAFPLSAPPIIDKHQGAQSSEDRCSINTTRASSSDNKLRALKQYRGARGLCDRCTEKSTYGHKCAPIVYLHVIQEMWDRFLDESCDSSGTIEESTQLCVFLSEAVTSGVESSQSMSIIGNIQGHQVLMLVDSKNSHSFVMCAIDQSFMDCLL